MANTEIEIKEVGAEIDVEMIGAEVGCPDVASVEMTEPVVSGAAVLRLGRTCAVPELVEVVTTDTTGVTVLVDNGTNTAPNEFSSTSPVASAASIKLVPVAAAAVWVV